MHVMSGETALANLARMGLYEEYVTWLVCFRNELEAFAATWPADQNTPPAGPVYSLQHSKLFLDRLKVLMSYYERHVALRPRRTSMRPVNYSRGLKRPAGLPRIPADNQAGLTLLREIEALLTRLAGLVTANEPAVHKAMRSIFRGPLPPP